MKETIVDKIDGGEPVIGHFEAPNGDGHSMVINGYFILNVQYKSGVVSTNKKKESVLYCK